MNPENANSQSNSFDDDLAFLDSLSNETPLNADEADASDLEYTAYNNHHAASAPKYAKHLQEIEEIQRFLTEQSRILAQRVDNSFSVIGQSIECIVREVNNLGLLSGKTLENVQRLNQAIQSYAHLAGTVSSVVEYNKNLNILLDKKKTIANEYLTAIRDFKKKTKDILNSHRQMLLQFTSLEYDLTKYQDKNRLERLVTSIKYPENIFRTTQYSMLMLEYLESEYKAWLNDQHHGTVEFPTLRTATQKTLDVISNIDNCNYEKRMSQLLSGDVKPTVISGRDILFLSAPHLSAHILLGLGQDKGMVDITNPYELDTYSLSQHVFFVDAMPYPLSELTKDNPALSISAECECINSHDSNWLWRWKPLLGSIALFVGLILVAGYFIEDSTWLGLAGVASLIFAIVKYNSWAFKIRDDRDGEQFFMRNQLRRHLLSLAGYQYHEEMDGEKKSVVREVLREVWQ